MRVLVTGGAGFVGSAIVRECLTRGHQVIAMDDLSTGSRDRVPRSDRLCFSDSSIENRAVLREMVLLSDRVFHAAGTGDPQASTVEVMRDVEAAEIVLDTCAASGRPLLIPSAAEVYGDRSVAVETDPIAVAPPTRSGASFVAGKLLIEASAMERHQQGLLDVVVARLFDLVGPAGHGRRWVAQLLRQAVEGEPMMVPGSGQQRRALLHVDDAARALVDLIEVPHAFGRIVNVGSEEEVSLLQLARRLKQLTRSRAPILRTLERVDTHLLTPRRVPSLSRLRRLVRGESRSLDALLLACLKSRSPKR